MKNWKIRIIAVISLLFALASCQQINDSEMLKGDSLQAASSRAVIEDWNSATVYLGGQTAAWTNHKWEAKWWTQGDEPGTGGPWGPWKDLGFLVEDTIPPTAPGLPAVTNITANEASISWAESTDNMGVAGYRVSFNGGAGTDVTATSFQAERLRPLTDYVVSVIAIDIAGLESPVSSSSFRTLEGTNPDAETRGIIDFHLHLGVIEPMDQLVLDDDAYTDLIMSNFVAGVMYGHLVKSYYPGIQYDSDFMYGSIMGQLLQENLGTYMYTNDQDLIAPSPLQQAVMGKGQGGPYQINNYAADMVNGSYTPGGHSLINMVALQKSIGFTMAGAPLQHLEVTPLSFNDKYFSPILTSYFHYLDFVALIEIGKGEGGWTTPWQPNFDNVLVHFKTLENNFLDVLLNVAYNQGFYGPLMKRYTAQAVDSTAATIATVRDWASVWGITNTYEQYPFQVQYYLYQLYGNPIPTTSPTTLVVKDVELAFTMTELKFVFSKVFQSLGYVNSAGQYVLIPAADADSAFDAALAGNSVAITAALNLSNAPERAQIFSILEDAVSGLESALGTSFIESTMEQL